MAESVLPNSITILTSDTSFVFDLEAVLIGTYIILC